MHGASEEVRNSAPIADEFILSVCAMLSLSRKNSELYHTTTCGLHQPPRAVSTRWGTWLCAAAFHHENFDAVLRFIDALDDRTSHNRLRKLSRDIALRAQLAVANSALHIANTIKMAEASRTPANRIVESVDEIARKLDPESPPGSQFRRSLSSNPGLARFRAEFMGRHVYAFAPLTKCAIERLFQHCALCIQTGAIA